VYARIDISKSIVYGTQDIGPVEIRDPIPETSEIRSAPTTFVHFGCPKWLSLPYNVVDETVEYIYEPFL
jgi:hypothetical protein